MLPVDANIFLLFLNNPCIIKQTMRWSVLGTHECPYSCPIARLEVANHTNTVHAVQPHSASTYVEEQQSTALYRALRGLTNKTTTEIRTGPRRINETYSTVQQHTYSVIKNKRTHKAS